MSETLAGPWSEPFAAHDEEWPDLLLAWHAEPGDWRSLAREGGYPVPAHELGDAPPGELDSDRSAGVAWGGGGGARDPLLANGERGGSGFRDRVAGRVLAIEIKSTRRPRLADAEYPDQTRWGLVLHTGDDVFRLSEGIVATPWWRVI